MILTDKEIKEFEKVVRPLMKWMSDNCHPHVNAVVDYSRAGLNEGVVSFVTEDYVKD